MASVNKEFSEHDMLTFAGFICEEFGLDESRIDLVYKQFMLFVQMQRSGHKLFEHINSIEQEKKRREAKDNEDLYQQKMQRMLEIMKQKELYKRKIQYDMEKDRYRYDELFNKVEEGLKF